MDTIRRHTWTIVTNEVALLDTLKSIFPGKSRVASQPTGCILHTLVTYDPITPEQSQLLKQSPEDRPEGIIALRVSSVDVDKLVDPSVMTDQERSAFANTFKGLAHQFEGIAIQLTVLQTLYPGLEFNDTFIPLIQRTEQMWEGAVELATYILVASDEEWKQGE
jgi:hypothetical protein